MKIFVRIQSRLSSRRLPGKALLVLKDRPIVQVCYERVKCDDFDVKVITSSDSSDDPLANFLEEAHISYKRGSLSNVLQRFYDSIDEADDEDIVVRLTADNILPDANLIRTVLRIMKASKVDYISTTNLESAIPFGLSVEAFKFKSLKLAVQSTTDEFDLEHVTPWIRRKTSCKILDEKDLNLSLQRKIRCTIDNFSDYLFMSRTMKDFALDSPWEAIVEKMNQSKSFDKLVLGTAQLASRYGRFNGQKASLSSGLEVLSEADALGIRHIDTAAAYVQSEETIGGSPFDFAITSKIFPHDDFETSGSNQEIKYLVRQSVHESLIKLNRSKITSFLLHRFNHLENKAIVEEMLDLKKKGLFEEVGVSVQSPEELKTCLTEYSNLVEHIQMPLNILDYRWLDDSIYRLLIEKKNIKIHTRSAFLQGLLLNSEKKWPVEIEPHREKVRSTLMAHDESFENDPLRVCFAFLKSFSWIDGIVVGADNSLQLREISQAYQESISLSERDAIDLANKFSFIDRKALNPANWSP